MEAKYKVNRLQTTNAIRALVDKHWSDLRTAKEKGEKAVADAGCRVGSSLSI